MFEYTQLSEIVSKRKSEGLLYNKFRHNRPLSAVQRRRLDAFLEQRVEDSPLHYNLAITTLRNRAPYIYSKYNKYFKHDAMKILHYKELIDITLGYDCYSKTFITDATLSNKGNWIMGYLTRHHIDRIKSIISPFLVPYLIPRKLQKFFQPNGLNPKGGWRVMLSPIYFETHDALHNRYRSVGGSYDEFSRINSLGAARETHLYEILQRPYDKNLGINYYRYALLQELKSKHVNIHGKEEYIWLEEDIDPEDLVEIVDRWIEKKDTLKLKDPNREGTRFYILANDPWYQKYYPHFYQQLYKPCEKYVIQCLLGNKNIPNYEFYLWYTTGYLRQDLYPIQYYP